MKSLKNWLIVSTATIACAFTAPAAAEWPEAPINLVVPWATGGSTDTLARILSDALSKVLDQTVIVENKAGAGGTIGAQVVARAKPDGYTFLLGVSGDQINAEFLHSKLNYSPREDLIPVALVASESVMMAANSKLGAKSPAELVKLARERDLTIATSGHGSNGHLSSMLLTQKAGIEATVVPYKGAAPAVNDTLAGHTHLVVGTPATLIQHVQSGSLSPIAVTTEKRIRSLPDVPTFKESGIDFTITTYYMVMAPKGTPESITSKLGEAIKQVLKEERLVEQVRSIGAEPEFVDAAQLAKMLSVERDKVGAVMKSLPPATP